MHPAPEVARQLAVLTALAGRHGGLLLLHSPRQPAGLHVRALRALQSLHAALLPQQRGGPGPDVQLLHRPGLAHQLQHLLRLLLGLQHELQQAHEKNLYADIEAAWQALRTGMV